MYSGVFDLKKQHRRAEISAEKYQAQAQEMIHWLDEFIAQEKDPRWLAFRPSRCWQERISRVRTAPSPRSQPGLPTEQFESPDRMLLRRSTTKPPEGV